jgi:hypothetical protein
MSRIKDYITDVNLTFSDRVIGSDGDDFDKTKNFTIADLVSFVQTNDTNNIAKIITTSVGVSETIESKLSGINLTVTGEDSPVLLSFLKEDVDQDTGNNIVRKFLYLFPLGNGSYNPLSDTVSLDDLVLLNVTNPTSEDISNLPNTTTIDLGDITGSSLVDEVNGSVPSLNLSDTEIEYFFTFIDGGTSFLFKFVGTNGLYGSNDLQSTSSDFLSFSDNTVDDDNVKAKYVQVVLNSSYSDETQEIAGVVSQINGLSSSVEISDKELFIAYSQGDLENDAGTAYKSVYIINSGKGVYGLNAKKITSDNVIKIRGEQINENLSSFNNDAGFATETYVDNADNLKVNKSGDTMTGNLNMSNNRVTDVGLPSNDQDVANKFYVDSLNRYRGNFISSSNILSLSGNNGDYATLSNGDVNQLWVYQNSEWILEGAKPYISDVASNISTSNDLHKSTLNITGSLVTLTLTDDVIDGLEFNIRNYSGSVLTFSTSGQATTNVTQLLPDNLATIIYKSGTYTIDTTSSEINENISVGIYDYNDDDSTFSLSPGVFTKVSSDDEGLNSYKDPAPGVLDVYDPSTGEFDFSDMNMNDIAVIILTGEITTNSSGEVFDSRLVVNPGGTGSYNKTLASSVYFKNAGTYSVSGSCELYMGNDLTRLNPSEIEVKTSGTSTFSVDSFYVRILKRD